MIDKELIALAFAVRKLNPWKKLSESGLFAVKFKAKVYICTVVGRIGEQPMIILNRSLNTFGLWKEPEISDRELYDYQKMEEVYSNDALCCRYTCKSDLSVQMRLELECYCKSEGFVVRGADAWPDFYSMIPYRTPVPMADGETELMKTMFKGLEAIMERFKPGSKELLCWDEGKIETIQMPEMPRPVYSKLKPLDEFTVRRLKKQKKEGDWIAKLVMIDAPIEDDEGAYFPFGLILADADSSELLRPIINQKAEDLPVTDILFNEKCPDTIYVYDDRTYELINDWMNRIGVCVEYTDEPEGMEEYISSMMQHCSMMPEDIEDMLMAGLQDADFLKTMPDELLLEAYHNLFDGTVPPELEAEVKRRGLDQN